MTEKQSQEVSDLKTSGRPSGGSSEDYLERLPASSHGGPENSARGRQTEQRRRRKRRWAQDCEDINTDELWQMKGGQREVCPPEDDHMPQGENCEPLQETLNQEQEEKTHINSDTGLDAPLGWKMCRGTRVPKKRLTGEENKAVEETDTTRASQMREEYEHQQEEPDLNTDTGVRTPSGGRMEDPVSEEFFNNERDDGGDSRQDVGLEFQQRDFEEIYEMYHLESLHNMTKQQLVRDYRELEKRVSRQAEDKQQLRDENNQLRRTLEQGGQTVQSLLVRVRELENMLKGVKAENKELLRQIDSLQFELDMSRRQNQVE